MKLVTVVGARPQFIKSGPVSSAIDAWNRGGGAPIDEVMVHTGQHYDQAMSGVFFDELGLRPPAVNLAVGSGSHAWQTSEILRRLDGVLESQSPDRVLVYGDTNSTLAGALAAAKRLIPLDHVEAGLRSGRRDQPEETNRVITDRLSTLLLCPTETAVANLRREGILEGVRLVGDVMYDSILATARVSQRRSSIVQSLHLTPGGYALATVHRAENTDVPVRLVEIVSALGEVAAEGLQVVFPVHPRTREALERMGASLPAGVIGVEPVSYLDMVALERSARLVLTDSGGVQKEAYFLDVPCVTLREETEWPETLEGGGNHLAGTTPERVRDAVRQALAWRPGQRPDAFGDGRAAERIVVALMSHARCARP